MEQEIGLFGIINSNRDLTDKDNWGKNKFNNNFPVALINYMDYKEIDPVYLTLNRSNKDNKLSIKKKYITTEELFGLSSTSASLYFSFETVFQSYQRFSIGDAPRADLVTLKLGEDNRKDVNLQSLEIKLTALPDNSTANLTEDEFGSELVIRPDTIVYMAFSIIESWDENISEIKTSLNRINDSILDWTDEKKALEKLPDVINILTNVFSDTIENQKPLIIQPIWKTLGKSPKLADNCLDVFVWSDLGFSLLFFDAARNNINKINRTGRSVIWLFKMLVSYVNNKKIDHKKIIDNYTYNTKNDKAFALSGSMTRPYMESEEIKNPRIKDNEIQNIILGGGEKYLSPERRFDAVIVSAPGLFKNDKKDG